MKVGGKDVKMLIDLGVFCNVFFIKYFFKGIVVEKLSYIFKMYLKLIMLVVGKVKIFLVNFKNMESYLIDFIIVDGNFVLLFGLEIV